MSDGEVTRLSGGDRWLTAVDISRDRFADDSVSTVILARGDTEFADALAGTPLAIGLGVPLLITRQDALEPAIEAEIQRALVPSGTVILLGGTVALSEAVEARLVELGFETQRLRGDDRIKTSLAIAGAVDPDPDAILISRGWAFPDALAAGPAAANAGGVVILNPDGERSPVVEAYVAEHPEAEVFAIGGQMAALWPEATPVFGGTRHDTAVEVAERFFEAPTHVGLARSDTFPDSLGGGVHIGLLGGLILLTPPPHLEPPSEPLHATTIAYLCTAAGSLTTGYVYGGTTALSLGAEGAFGERIDGC